MARELDPVPGKDTVRRGLSESIRKLPSALARRKSDLATFADYQRVLADEKQKLTSEQVEYREGSKEEGYCRECVHFYRQTAGDAKVICEIYRGELRADGTCDFYSKDGTEFPNLDESRQPKEAAPEKSSARTSEEGRQ
jgi:hypothetical protein